MTGLPARVLILGLGFSGRAIARHLQDRGIEVSGTVRDPQAAPADGLKRHRLHEDAPPDAALCSALAMAEAVISSVPPDAAGDPALRRVQAHLQASTALRWVGCLSSTGVYADRADAMDLRYPLTLDASAIRDVLGFREVVSEDEALEKTLASYTVRAE